MLSADMAPRRGPSSIARRIDEIQRAAAADSRIIGLAGGLPAEAQFPKRALAASFLRVLRKSGAPALQYGWAEGSERLRSLIARRLRVRGAAVADEAVIITNGAQQAIAIGLELVARAGDRIGVGTETYPAALELMRSRRLVPISTDADAGTAPHTTVPKCAQYVMPVIGNPHGFALSDESRQALLGGGSYIVEDDAYADLRFDGPASRPLLADIPEQVLHVGTFSKTLSPGLRIGWLIAPRRLRRRALQIKQGIDLQANSLTQAIVEDYLTGGGSKPSVEFDERLVRLRRFYRNRATALARALRGSLPGWNFRHPEGGFAIWTEPNNLAERVDEIAFLKAAVRERVVFDPGSMFRPSGASHPLGIRLCFSAAPVDEFDAAIQGLARAYRRIRRR